MHTATSHTETGPIRVAKLNLPGKKGEWDYRISFGYDTDIYVSQAELVKLAGECITHISTAWGEED